MLTIKRRPDGYHSILRAGREIGEAWRFLYRSGFGVRVYGVFWRNGEPNIKGGSVATGVARLKDSIQLAERALALTTEQRRMTLAGEMAKAREDKMRYMAPNWAQPEWENAGPVHDWRNYISEEVREMWGTFTDLQKQALARQAEEAADREEWD